MFEYLNRHPTAAEILFVVHDVRVSGLSSKFQIDEQQFESGMSEVSSKFFGTPEKPPDDWRSNVKFASEMMEKLFKKSEVN